MCCWYDEAVNLRVYRHSGPNFRLSIPQYRYYKALNSQPSYIYVLASFNEENLNLLSRRNARLKILPKEICLQRKVYTLLYLFYKQQYDICSEKAITYVEYTLFNACLHDIYILVKVVFRLQYFDLKIY